MQAFCLAPYRDHKDPLPQDEPIQTFITSPSLNVQEYIQSGIDQDALHTYTSLDDYDAMFEARHCRGVVDNSSVITEGMISTTFPMIIPSQAEPISTRASSKDLMT